MKTSLGPKIIGLGSLGVVGFLIFLSILNNPDINGVIIQDAGGSINLDIGDMIEIQCNNNGTCTEISANSILPTQPKLADTNDSFLQQLLGSLTSNEIAIETVVVKYNLAGEQRTFRNAFNIQLENPAVVIDKDFIIENLQIAFFVDVKEPSSIDVQGTAELFLNNKLIESKKIFVSSPSIQGNQIAFNVGTAGVESFDFTFIDEDFKDGELNEFKVVVKEISGELITNGNKKIIRWDNPVNVYKLNLFVDKNTVTKLSETGDVITVTKSDSAVVVCAYGQYQVKKTIESKPKVGIVGGTHTMTIPAQMTDLVQLFNADKTVKIGEILPFKGEPNKNTCKKIPGIQRGSENIIHVKGQDISVKAPENSQHNYNIQWKYVDKKGGVNKFINLHVTCSAYKDPNHCKSGSVITYTFSDGKIYTDISSNFGYEFTNKP